MQKFDREATVNYAKEWALRDNPRFFTGTHCSGAGFVSECVYSGAGMMNDSKRNGWYYKNKNSKSISWNNHEKLFEFLINNKGSGPYAKEVNQDGVMLGDIVQFADKDNVFFHSAVITKIDGTKIYVCAHHYNSYMRPITSYKYSYIRFLHIIGVRNE